MKLKLIVAMCNNMGIGYNNNIPWHIKKDLIYFSNKTMGLYGNYVKDKEKNDDRYIEKYKYKIIKKNAIVMGKNTWMSLPKYPAPLPNRDNIIISNTIHTSATNYFSDINEKYNLLNMDNIKILSTIKTFYDIMYYANTEEDYKFKKKIDFIMYFSSILDMIDFCMASDKLCDNIFDSMHRNEMDIHSKDNNIKIDMQEMRDMCEINKKSNVNKINTNKDNIRDKTVYDEVWIIGGAMIYNSFIKENNKKYSNILINELCITYIDKYYECDTFFPKIENIDQYYISSFLKSEDIDTNNNITIPVYYITFTYIDINDCIHIEKRNIEVTLDSKNIVKKKYYYYIKSGIESDYGNILITNENACSFLWCITEVIDN